MDADSIWATVQLTAHVSSLIFLLWIAYLLGRIECQRHSVCQPAFFCHCKNVLERSRREGKAYSYACLLGFNPCLVRFPAVSLCWSRTAWQQKGMVEPSCSPHDAWEAERQERTVDSIFPSKIYPCDLLGPGPPPSAHHMSVMLSDYDSVNALTCWLGQSLAGLLTSQ